MMKNVLLLVVLILSQVWGYANAGYLSHPFVQILNQDKVISGIVYDKKGGVLPGVSVRIKGVNAGVTTNTDGKFTITVSKDYPVLVFSYIGFVTQEIVVGNKDSLSIVLDEESSILNEVVVVGYGTQKKVNVTGAVSSLTIDEKISNRTITTVSSALSGLLPGLAVQQSTGMAGSSGAKLLIRGLSTPNGGSNTNPLYVVDGMPDVDIDRIDMNDIESISVLKDAASAAVYGSRAARGVVLITTKSGKGLKQAKISYTGTLASSNPISFYHMLEDYPRALTLQQRASRAGRSQPNFSDGTIEEWMAMGMIDKVRYPSENQLDWITRTGLIQTHNISAQGGGEDHNYFLSVGGNNEKGILINNDASRYNFRLNVDYKIRKNISVGLRSDGQWTNMSYGLANGFVDYGSTNNSMVFAITGLLPYNETLKQYGGAMAYGEAPNAPNYYAEIMARHNNRERQGFNGNVYASWQPLKGLVARLDYGLNYYNQFEKSYADPGTYLYNFQTGNKVFELFPSTEGVSDNSVQGNKSLLQLRLNYDKEIFKGHQLGLLAIATEEAWLDRNFSARRGDRLHPSITEVNGGSTAQQFASGTSSREGLRSYVGRMNYSIDDKYLFEGSFRADASSKFSPGHQWGYFPSGSAGWRFSEESFFKSLKKVVSSGKLRFSYGSVGNNSGVNRYEQLQTFGTTPYLINGVIVQGVSPVKQLNEDFSWETTTVANLGLDLGFLENKLTAEIDVYDRLTTDLIRPSSLSSLLTGYNAPQVNIGDFRNNGIELNLTWRSNINSVNYGASFNAGYNIDRLEKWSEKLNPSKNFINMPWFFSYQMQSTGIAQTWDDIYNAPFHNNTNISPGDLLYKDLNGNGQIDNFDKVAAPKINEQRPTANYGLNLFGSWIGIDISVLFQASTGRKDYWLEDMTNVNINPQRYAFQELHWNDTWTLENRYASLPRIVSVNAGNNRSESDFWLQSMDYLRLKNIQLGYNIPPRLLKRIGVERIKIYGTAENLLTLTGWKGVDPEKSTLGNGFSNYNDDPFPLLKTISFGLNIGL